MLDTVYRQVVGTRADDGQRCPRRERDVDVGAEFKPVQPSEHLVGPSSIQVHNETVVSCSGDPEPGRNLALWME